MIKPTDPWELMNQFTQAVNVDKSRENLEGLLSREVEFETTTDNGYNHISGREEVIALFEEYIWGNTENINILSYGVKKANTMTPETKMVVLEKKQSGGEWNWYQFKVKTEYQLTVQDDQLVIDRMKSIQNQQFTPDKPFHIWKSFPEKASS